MATQIRTNVDFRLRGRHQMKVRIKTGNAVKLIEGRLRTMRKRFQLRLWQITEAHLDGSQFVKDHAEALAKLRCAFRHGRRRASRDLIPTNTRVLVSRCKPFSVSRSVVHDKTQSFS